MSFFNENKLNSPHILSNALAAEIAADALETICFLTSELTLQMKSCCVSPRRSNAAHDPLACKTFRKKWKAKMTWSSILDPPVCFYRLKKVTFGFSHHSGRRLSDVGSCCTKPLLPQRSDATRLRGDFKPAGTQEKRRVPAAIDRLISNARRLPVLAGLHHQRRKTRPFLGTEKKSRRDEKNKQTNKNIDLGRKIHLNLQNPLKRLWVRRQRNDAKSWIKVKIFTSSLRLWCFFPFENEEGKCLFFCFPSSFWIDNTSLIDNWFVSDVSGHLE